MKENYGRCLINILCGDGEWGRSEGTMTRGEMQLGPATDLRLRNGITLDVYVFNVPLHRERVWLQASKYKLASPRGPRNPNRSFVSA
jgi:hypothetical protein